MIERLKHLPSTLFGCVLIGLGVYVGLKTNVIDVPILLITSGLSFVGYKPGDKNNENN